MSLPEPTNQPDQVPSNPLEAQEQFRKRLRGYGIEVLRSSQSERIVRFKRGLVLDLFLRRGRFWEKITVGEDNGDSGQVGDPGRRAACVRAQAGS